MRRCRHQRWRRIGRTPPVSVHGKLQTRTLSLSLAFLQEEGEEACLEQVSLVKAGTTTNRAEERGKSHTGEWGEGEIWNRKIRPDQIISGERKSTNGCKRSREPIGCHLPSCSSEVYAPFWSLRLTNQCQQGQMILAPYTILAISFLCRSTILQYSSNCVFRWLFKKVLSHFLGLTSTYFKDFPPPPPSGLQYVFWFLLFKFLKPGFQETDLKCRNSAWIWCWKLKILCLCANTYRKLVSRRAPPLYKILSNHTALVKEKTTTSYFQV